MSKRIKFDSNNFNKHTKEGMELLEKSVREVGYAIGEINPVSLTAYADGLIEHPKTNVTFNSIRNLILNSAQNFEETAERGHFGNNYIWEQ